MPSTDRVPRPRRQRQPDFANPDRAEAIAALDRRHPAQRGASLIESLVAAALLGITAVVAITAWDTAIVSARRATADAWAHCAARAEMEAVLASTDAPPHVAGVTVAISAAPDTDLQLVTVTAIDPATTDQAPYQLSALRARALAGSGPAPPAAQVTGGCPEP